MKKKTIKIIGIIILTGLIIAAGIAFYMFNMPHRDVQSSKTDYSLTSTQLVDEYLTNSDLANEKYLQEEGNSKILAITGTIFSISEDQNNQKVVLLKNPDDKAGVSCTFTQETSIHANDLQVGQKVIIKGVIRSGADYDEDLDMYEDVIMEKCDLLQQ